MDEFEEILSKEVIAKTHCHAYLFVSPDRELLKQATIFFIEKCGYSRSDISEVQPASEEGKAGQILVDDVRALIHDISLSSHGSARIGVINQAEKLNKSSSNILLKTLEEPPKNVTIILTASSTNILTTVKSRCRLVRFNKIPTNKSITFSYHDFISKPLCYSFKLLEDVVKSGQVENLLQDLTFQFEEKIVSNYDNYSLSILEKIIWARKKIARNVNSRLVLENLVILMKYSHGR